MFIRSPIFIVFPESIWKKYGREITGAGKVEGTGGEDGRARKPDMQSKRTQELLRAQIAGIFDRFPQLDGLVLRFGETYLHDTPYHRGGGPIRGGELWSEWKALKVSSEYCATLYTDMAFRNEKKGSIGEFVDGLRAFVK
jgi:hypothetical protein